jgi:hypothetical protein
MVDFLEDMWQDEINQSYDVIDDKFCPEPGLLFSRCVAQARGVSVYGYVSGACSHPSA